MARVQAQAGRVRQDAPPHSVTHSALVTLLETSDSNVSLLRGGSRWVLAKYTKGACSLSQQPRAPRRRSTRGSHSGFRLIKMALPLAMVGHFCQLQLVLSPGAFTSCVHSLLIPTMELRTIRLKDSSSALFPLSPALSEIPGLQTIIRHLCLSQPAQRPHHGHVFINL